MRVRAGVLAMGTAVAWAAPARAQDPAAAPRAATAAEGGFDLARDLRPRHTAVWVQPVWLTTLGPRLGRYNFGAGATVMLRNGASLVLEAGFDLGSYQPADSPFRVNYDAVTAAAGVAFYLGASRPLNGLFLQPKVFAAAYSSAGGAGHGPGSNVGVAVDIGYQLTAGPVFFSPVIGLGVGVGVAGERSDDDRSVGRVGVAVGYFAPTRGPFLAINLALLRLGLAF